MRWLVLTVAAFAVIGCGSGQSEATKEQTKAFDGGPMPPEAQQRMQEGLARGQQGGADAAQQARENAMKSNGG